MSQQRGEELDEAAGEGEFPPEEPLGVEAYGTTPAEEADGEPLDERIAREEPDRLVPGDEAVELVAPDEGAHPDEEGEEVGSAVADGAPVEPEDPTELTTPPPAEEAAVHVTPEP